MRYGLGMCRGTRVLAFCCGLFGWAGQAAVADELSAPTNAVPENSYIVITNRNAFKIVPPPVPPPAEPIAPTVPPPNLFLTGISHLNGITRAYLVVNKANARLPEYLAVDEGYDSDGLQVLTIDARKQAVRVRNAGTELTLNFKDNGLKPNSVPVNAPGAGNAPGMAPTRGVPPPPMATAPGAGPTIIGRGAANLAQPVAANAAGTEAVATERQLPSRRQAVYLGRTVSAGAGVDSGTPTTLPVAPSVPGKLINSSPRPGLIVPPLPQIPGQ